MKAPFWKNNFDLDTTRCQLLNLLKDCVFCETLSAKFLFRMWTTAGVECGAIGEELAGSFDDVRKQLNVAPDIHAFSWDPYALRLCIIDYANLKGIIIHFIVSVGCLRLLPSEIIHRATFRPNEPNTLPSFHASLGVKAPTNVNFSMKFGTQFWLKVNLVKVTERVVWSELTVLSFVSRTSSSYWLIGFIDLIVKRSTALIGPCNWSCCFVTRNVPLDKVIM